MRTPLYVDPGLRRGLDHCVTTANTHVIEHDDRLLALEEGGLPYELTADLDTVGPFTFDGRLARSMTAHPKRCPTTGDLLFFGYSVKPTVPDLPLCARRRRPRCDRSTIELPACSLMHDFAVTASKVLFFDSCLVFDLAAMSETGSPWRWDHTRAARIGVLERDDITGEPTWFEVEPCHLSHAANAFDDGDAVVLTGTRIPPDDASAEGGLPVMHEWRLDLTERTVTESALDDVSTEYPRVPDALVGLPAQMHVRQRVLLRGRTRPRRDPQVRRRRSDHTPASGGPHVR